MAVIPITELTIEGEILAAPIAATGNDTIEANDGLLVVEIENTTGTPLTCRFISTYSVAGMDFPNRNVVVPAFTAVWTRPIPPAYFNDERGDVAVQGDSGLLLRGLRF